MFFFGHPRFQAPMSFGRLDETKEAVEANLVATFEGARAFVSACHAVNTELSRFARERIERHGDLALSLASGLTPMALFDRLTAYTSAEAGAWEAEQSKLVGLFSQAVTESLVTFEDIAEIEMPTL